jgi:CheY-like chemotaxis protein
MVIKSIMVVDDSEADQFLTGMVIEEYNSAIEIIQASDGQEALKKLEEMVEKPCVIILDINMPRMNGFEFLEEYNKRDYTVKIITMLTSSDQINDREKALQFKCVHGYSVKPLEVEALRKLVKNT